MVQNSLNATQFPCFDSVACMRLHGTVVNYWFSFFSFPYAIAQRKREPDDKFWFCILSWNFIWHNKGTCVYIFFTYYLDCLFILLLVLVTDRNTHNERRKICVMCGCIHQEKKFKQLRRRNINVSLIVNDRNKFSAWHQLTGKVSSCENE